MKRIILALLMLFTALTTNSYSMIPGGAGGPALTPAERAAHAMGANDRDEAIINQVGCLVLANIQGATPAITRQQMDDAIAAVQGFPANALQDIITRVATTNRIPREEVEQALENLGLRARPSLYTRFTRTVKSYMPSSNTLYAGAALYIVLIIAIIIGQESAINGTNFNVSNIISKITAGQFYDLATLPCRFSKNLAYELLRYWMFWSDTIKLNTYETALNTSYPLLRNASLALHNVTSKCVSTNFFGSNILNGHCIEQALSEQALNITMLKNNTYINAFASLDPAIITKTITDNGIPSHFARFLMALHKAMQVTQ